MRNILRIIILILASQIDITAYTQEKLWADSYGGDGNTEWANNVMLKEGSIFICGLSNSSNGTFPNSSGEDVWILVMNTTGTVLDTLSYGGSANDGGKEIIPTSDGGYILTGISFSTDGDAAGANYHGTGDVWVVKLDASFNIEWQQMYGGSNRDDPQSIIETNDGNFLIAAYTTSSDGDVTGFHSGSPIWNDAWVLKIDPTGTILWQKCIGGSADEAAWSIAETPTSYVFTGHSQSSDGDISVNYGNRDLLVASLAKASGNINWVKNYGGSEMDTGLDLIYSSRNTLTVTGHANSNDYDVVNLNGQSEFWYLDLDTLGNIITCLTYGSPGSDIAYGIEEIDVNRYVLAGSAGYAGGAGGNVSNIYGSSDGWALELDAAGTILSEKNFGGSLQDVFYGTVLSEQGILFAAGKTTSSDFDLTHNMGGNDWFVAGISYQVAVEISNPTLPSESDLWTIFPNPSSGNINIKLGYGGVHSIELFDTYGRVLQKLSPGKNMLMVPEGIYFIKVSSENNDKPLFKKILIEN